MTKLVLDETCFGQTFFWTDISLDKNFLKPKLFLHQKLFWQISETKPAKINLPNQTKTTKLNLPNQTYQTKPTKPNLQN